MAIDYYINLPDIITWLCKRRIQNSRKGYSAISDYIEKDQFLSLYSKSSLYTNEKVKNLEEQLSAYGVQGLRDRLASAYIFKQTHGFFPQNIDLYYVAEVQEFEERFSLFTNEWNSRVFMLGFYLKMKDIVYLQEESEEPFINLSLEVDEVLTTGNAKIEKLDWLIVLLNELLKFMDKTKIEKLLEEHDGSFYPFLENLKAEEKKIVMQELLRYGFAINETELFLYQKV